MIVGADGIRSTVARAFGVGRSPLLGDRVGLTFHVADPGPTEPARRADDPVPGRICRPCPGPRPPRQRRHRPRSIVGRATACARRGANGRRRSRGHPAGRRRSRRLARGRAMRRDRGRRRRSVTASRGATVPAGCWSATRPDSSIRSPAKASIGRSCRPGSRPLRSSATSTATRTASPAYDRAMTARFRSKDVLSLLVQAFLARPALFDYAARRLAGRRARP